MEGHIIVGLSLTLIILLFAIWKQRQDMRVLQAETHQRVDNQITALQAEIFRLEGVRRAFRKDNRSVVFYRRSPPEIFTDNPYWSALSAWLREEKQWTCENERCRINLEKRRSDLHVHHVLGRGFNSPQHLKVLCIACHAEEPDHAFMKSHPEYKAFLKWRKGSG